MMRLRLCWLMVMLLPVGMITVSGQPSIGGFNVYYGHLHNHCNVSDGSGSPFTAYNYAKNTAHLDFFSLADHSRAISPTEWDTLLLAADMYNEPGVFTAFRGFEWSSSGAYGHVAVINSDDYCTVTAPANTFPALCEWLNARECIAFFNHPGRENDIGLEFSHFTSNPSPRIAGMELWNKNDAFSDYYYNDGYYPGDGNLGYYDEALIRNWNIGPSGSEDNHLGTWGNFNEYRLAVLASANTREDIYNALKARRFFSTLDKNLALSFQMNGSEMGSTLGPGSLAIRIRASDGDGELFTTISLLMNGSVTESWTPNSAAPDITASAEGGNGDYFYIVVQQADGDEAISAPIRISNGIPVPVTAEITVSGGDSDAEERESGNTYVSSTDLELVYDSYNSAGNQVVGVRFAATGIPRFAVIDSAFLQFTCDEVSTGACSLTIRGEATDNSQPFTGDDFNISGRTVTSASVSWDPPVWPVTGASGPEQRTPDISSLVTEIVNRPGYTASSAITFILTGTGVRTAEAYEGSPSSAAKLIVTFLPVPGQMTVQDVTIENGREICYNATQSVFVAGNGTLFEVQPSGSATFFSSGNILFLSGTTVLPGGIMLARIVPAEGPFCEYPPMPIPGVRLDNPENISRENPSGITVYPNPTEGEFKITIGADIVSGWYSVEVFSTDGKKIIAEKAPAKTGIRFSLSGRPAGLYHIRIATEKFSGSARIIKL